MNHRKLSLHALFLLSTVLTPLVSAQTVIMVSAYGATPDDGMDDIDAINAAIAALPQSNGILRFDAGTYDISPSLSATLGPPAPIGATGPDKKPIFPLSNKTGLTIEGNGATLLCHEFNPNTKQFLNYYDLFRITTSSFVTVQDLTVNMSRLPFSVGYCYQVNYVGLGSTANNFRVLMHSDFRNMPNPTQMRIHAMSNWRGAEPVGQNFNHLQQWPKMQIAGTTPDDFYVSWTTNVVNLLMEIRGRWPTLAQLPPGRTFSSYPGYQMALNLPNPAAPNPLDAGKLIVGDDVVFAHAYRLYNAFDFQNCSHSLVSNLTVYSWPGKALRMLQDQDAVIDGLQVLPDPARDHVVSTTGEAMVLRNMKGSLLVQDCSLMGMLHDGVNLYTDLLPKATTPQPAGPTIDVQAAVVVLATGLVTKVFPAGSNWEFYDANMLPLGTALLSVPSGIPGPLFPARQTHQLTFASLPAAKSAIAYVCCLDESPLTDIQSLTVERNHGNGLVVRGDVNVSNAYCDHVSGSGVRIGPSLSQQFKIWPDYIPAIGAFLTGPSGKNVVVDNSAFYFCNRGAGLTDYSEGTVHIQTSIFTKSTATGGVIVRSSGIYGSISGITLQLVDIQGAGGATIANRSVDNVTIDNCTLGPCNDLGFLLPILPLGAGRFAGESLIFSHNAGNVLIQYNQGLGFLNPDRTWAPIYGYRKVGNVGF